MITDTKKEYAVIVDPGESEPVLHYLEQHHLRLAAILITHHHADHIHGVPEILRACGEVPVFGKQSHLNPVITQAVADGSSVDLPWVGLQLKVLPIPGHTVDHIAYYAPQILFCGDTLFSAGCGRLLGGNATQLYQSLQKISALPNDTLIYCTHEYTLNNLLFAKTVEPDNKQVLEYLEVVKNLRKQDMPTLPSSLAQEKLINPFLRCDEPTVIQSIEAHTGITVHNAEQAFTLLRQWKDGFKG